MSRSRLPILTESSDEKMRFWGYSETDQRSGDRLYFGQKLMRDSLDELNEIRGLKVDNVALPFVTNSERASIVPPQSVIASLHHRRTPLPRRLPLGE